MRPLSVLALALLAVVLLVARGAGAQDVAGEIDYANIAREIRAEPEYVGAPRYALFVLDDAGDFLVWAVLDRSRADLEYLDVLYLDLNGNGDLTEEGERFAGTYDERRAASGGSVVIGVGDIRVPGTEIVHENFRVFTIPKKGRKGIWFNLVWEGRTETSGGYAPVGTDTHEWAAAIADAPIFHPSDAGRFAFGLYTWGARDVRLPVGGEAKVYVMIGKAGSGPDTLAVVSEEAIDLEMYELRATVIGRDAEGEVVSLATRITAHC